MVRTLSVQKKHLRSSAQPGGLRAAGIALLLLAAVIACVLGRASTGGFLNWDDQLNVSLNPDLNPPTAESVAKYWRERQLGMYIPIVYTVWGGLAWLARLPNADASGITLNPAVFHAANLLLHFIGSFLVWLILTRLLAGAPARHGAALAGALLFAIHPLQVEPVAWVTGMKDVLSGVFSLGSLLLYIVAAQNTAPAERGSRLICFSLSTFLYGIALLSKPSAACLPLMAIVIDRMIFNRPWKAMLPLMALWVAMAGVIAWVTSGSQASLMTFQPSWDLRPFVALDAIGFYIGKVFIPFGLGVDQGRSPMMLLQNGTLRWSWIPALILGLALWLNRKRFSRALAPALLFLAGLAPVLGLSPFIFQDISTVADRFAYLAMLGPALLLAVLLARFPSLRARVAAGAVIGLFGFASCVQTGYWHDDLGLMAHSLQVNPESEVATEALGAATSRKGDQESLRRGNELYARALAMKWDDAAALIGMGSNLHKQDKLPEASHCLEKALLIEPSNADGRFNFANVLMAEHRTEKAVEQYELSLRTRPRNLPALLNLGFAQAMVGNWSHSEQAFREAIDAAPASAEAHAGLGRVLEARGDGVAALVEYNAAIQLKPDLAPAVNGRARVESAMRH
jgi:tetratricopeptide (TPR) repeat protein